MNKVVVLTLGTVFLAGLTSACGSSAAPHPATRTSPSSAASHPHLIPIKVVEAVNAPAYAPVTLAQAAGIFRKNGLRVTIVPLSAGSTAAAALISGSAQFDAGVASDALLADSHGNHLISIAALTNAINLVVEVGSAWAKAHHITPQEPVATRLHALQGAKIGITAPGSITDLAIRFMFHTVGMKSGVNYHEVAIGSPAANLAALKANGVQATIFDPSFAAFATKQGAGVVGLSGLEFPVLANAAFGAVITTQSYASAHPHITRMVAKSFAQANNLIVNHTATALKYIDRQYAAIPKSILAKSIPQYHFALNGRTTTQAWSNMAKIFVQNGELTAQQAHQAVHEFTNRYVP